MPDILDKYEWTTWCFKTVLFINSLFIKNYSPQIDDETTTKIINNNVQQFDNMIIWNDVSDLYLFTLLS